MIVAFGALAAAGDARARHGDGGHRGAGWAHHDAGRAGRYHSYPRGQFHGHRFHRRFHGTFFFGAPLPSPGPYDFGLPYSYYYFPSDWLPYYEAPPVYVEKFDGTPTPGMRDIYCPDEGAYYPEVRDCPGGWMRILG